MIVIGTPYHMAKCHQCAAVYGNSDDVPYAELNASEWALAHVEKTGHAVLVSKQKRYWGQSQEGDG